MSQEGGKPPPEDADYFGINAEHDHGSSPATGVGSNSGPPASANSGTAGTTGTANTSATATETERGKDQAQAHKDRDDSRRGHKDSSKRGHKHGNSSRRARGGHKESGRDHRDSDRRPSKEHTKDTTRDRDQADEHNRRHKPKNAQAPPDTAASVMDDLEEMEFYHGNILEDEIKQVLNKHGDYMLRMTVGPEGGKGIFVTILWNDAATGSADLVNLPIRAQFFDTEGGKEYLYTLDSKTRCPTIKDLIRKHTMMAIPVIRNKCEVWLLNPIAKQSWELRPENLELIKKLGEGAFGEVYSGKLRLRFKKFSNVAVKVIKRSANTEAATMELQKEAAIMRKLKHINIVRFFGMVVKKDTIMVVMELINGGGLDKYLKKFPDTSANLRTGFAADIATGLAYLHDQKVMHRDVACRNCLLDMYRIVAKVSDFGLARTAEEYRLRAEERIPIRWTAPEVVKTYVYTRQADIYAYAVLVYEIFSNAALPFEGYTNAQIKDQIHNNDFRPKFPDSTPHKVVEIVSRCWHGEAAQRTPLMEVSKALRSLVPKGDDDAGIIAHSREKGNKGTSKENNKGTSKEKFSKAKKPPSKRSKERQGGKSKEFVKSVKSGRTKREGRGGGPSRERAE